VRTTVESTYTDITKYRLPLATALAVFSLLAFVEVLPKRPLLLFERAYAGAGWLQIALVSIYAFIVAYNMQNPAKSALWRRRTWFFFSIIFFGQLFLGLLVSSFFLMTGKLHLPIPAMIIAGPLYRGQGIMMPTLLVTTIALSGPAWCSHICYFGGFDNVAATGTLNKPVGNILAMKHTILLLVIGTSLLFRIFNAPLLWAVSLGLAFGLTGVGIILLYSRKRGKMIHCMLYCPIGTIVHFLKNISPFRLRIEHNCTACCHCSTFCKYGALEKVDILRRKPGLTCTLCGDCLVSCPNNSLQYHFFRLSPDRSRQLWLFITISLHAVTLAVARI
jgi:ferredoxin